MVEPVELALELDALNAVLARRYALIEESLRLRAVEVKPGIVVAKQPFSEQSIRAGAIVSGPALMAAADGTAYALVAAHVGDVVMAVTSSLTIHFLRAAQPGHVMAQATLLRRGRRTVTADVKVWTEGPDRIAAQALVAYTLPG